MRSRSPLAALAAALAVGVALAPALPAAPATPRVVGQVVSVGGSKKLLVRDRATGRLTRVVAKERLVVGERLLMGAGVTATLRIKRPAGVSSAIDLITLTPVARTPHLVRVSSKGGFTIVRILPG